jgi:hypothetical protein
MSPTDYVVKDDWSLGKITAANAADKCRLLIGKGGNVWKLGQSFLKGYVTKFDFNEDRNGSQTMYFGVN